MNLNDLLTEWRRRIEDTEGPPFRWSNEEGIAFANQAEREACERANLIEDDKTPGVVAIAGQPNQGTYGLHKSIIEVRSCLWNGRFLDGIARETLNNPHHHRRDAGNFADCGGFLFGELEWDGNRDWSTLTGTPRYFIDPQEKYLTLVRIPIIAAPIRLSVYRYPLEPLCNLEDEPEIAHRHHYRLIDWMEHLAFQKQDTECFDPKKVVDKEALFVASFGIRPDANVRRMQRARRSNQVRLNPGW